MKYMETKEYPLKEKIAEHDMSLRSIAKEIGVDFTHLSRLQNEKMVATPETAEKIIGWFNELDNK